MVIGDEVGRVRKLSDDELLAGLCGALGSSRMWTALVLAHLAEVDVRRLHLLAGFGSLFSYCMARLGMSEDEAWRRIEVARLARSFPLLHELLASGTISLSVAVLLRHHLTESNHVALLDAVSRKTVARAREVLAAWFPQGDVPPSIRKLPERRRAATANEIELRCAPSGPAGCGASAGELSPEQSDASCASRLPEAAATSTPMVRPDTSGVTDRAAVRTLVSTAASTSSSTASSSASTSASTSSSRPPSPARTHGGGVSCIQPLSPGRYKIAFTADAELKRKLELASDLLRHAVPRGDLATLVGRALDLLLEETMRRRFAKTSRAKHGTDSASQPPTAANAAELPGGASEEESLAATTARQGPSLEPRAAEEPAPCPAPPGAMTTGPSVRPDTLDTPDTPDAVATRSPARPDASERPAAPEPAPHQSRHIPSVIRRTVLDRDGLRCTWTGPDGTRCESRAWLERDHAVPRGLGGANDAANVRHFCRAHNRLAAEQAYGKLTITRIIARRRAKRAATVPTPPIACG